MKLSIAFVLIAASAVAQPIPNGSKRIINGQTFEVTPAWKSVRGTKTGVCIHGWTVATREGNVILRNPPVAELQEFDRLNARYNALQARKQALMKADREANKGRAQATRESRDLEAQRFGSTSELQRARDQHQRAQDRINGSYDTLNANSAEIEAIDDELKELNGKGYKLGGVFQINCRAFETKINFQGMTVYDRGAALR
jgi:hypothetical protein